MNDTPTTPDTAITPESLTEQGFMPIDGNRLESNPPRISWGEKFKLWDHDRQILYLKRLASTMNHAASTLQTDFNKASKLLVAKERALTKLATEFADNTKLLQEMATKLNAESQGANQYAQEQASRIKELEARVKELEGGDND